MTSKYNVWNSWDPLKKVMLGNNYLPEFFKDIKNQKTRSALMQIAEETLEDLDQFENILKSHNVEVVRPYVDPNDNIMNHINIDGAIVNHRVQRGPLQPRDGQLVIGDKLFITSFDAIHNPSSITEYLLQNGDYDYMTSHSKNYPMFENVYNQYSQDAADWPNYSDYVRCFNTDKKYSHLSDIQREIELAHQDYYSYDQPDTFVAVAPSVTVLGKDIYVNCRNTHRQDNLITTKEILDRFANRYKNFRVNQINVEGHSDGSFVTLKPGAILSLHEVQDYDVTFPRWEVCYLPEEGFKKIPDFWNLKKELYGKWWVPGQEDNHEFNYFVHTWLTDWVGYVEETVFDVNVLVVDEHHVCVSQLNNEKVNQFLKKHNMEPILVPWRHRYFWDGGLHCITLDLYREGKQQDYFPNRKTAIVDIGFD